jgi:methionyl-tRNA formyltransferase
MPLSHGRRQSMRFARRSTIGAICTIKPVATLEQIAFTTTTVVPPNILHAIGYGAHNFHPGPPSYPGWAPAHFAIYEQASHFGATLHLMTERVDSGLILDYVLFPIPAVAAVLELEAQAYCELLRLFLAWAGLLSTEPSPLEPRRATDWSARRNTRRTYQAACCVPLDVSERDLSRRMRAFGGNHFGMAPTITLHGVEFRATALPSSVGPCRHTKS